MKNINIKLLVLFIIIVSLSVILAGCKALNTPPSVEAVQQFYHDHSKDIQVIMDFMLSAGYEDIYITDNDGTMFADFNKVSIEDAVVLESIDRIINRNAYQNIAKRGNIISLLQWTGIRDIGCGIAYSINGVDIPDFDYITEIIPLSDKGWFYYVDDYNLWCETNR